MEGFVFDLQRFADTDWPAILNNSQQNLKIYYLATNTNGVYSISRPNEGQINHINNYYNILVQGSGTGSFSIAISGPSSESEENEAISLDFSGVVLGGQRVINIGQKDVVLTSVPNNAYIILPNWAKVGISTINAGATVTCNGRVFSGTENGSAFSISSTNNAPISLWSGGFALDSAEVYQAYGDVTVCGTGTVYCYDSHTITVNKKSSTENDIDISNAANITTTVIANNEAKVNIQKVNNNSTTLVTYTSCQADSRLTASGKYDNVSVKLTKGVFAYAGTDTVTLGYSNGTGAGVKYGSVTYTAGEDNTKCSYNNSKVTLTAGKLTCSAAATVIANSTEYSLTANSTISSGAVLSGGGVNLSNGKSITVSNANGDKTSTVAAGAGSSIDVSVNNGTYTISNLADGDSVSIDGRTYNYTEADGVGKLLCNYVGWKKSASGSASITFTIKDGTGSFTDTLSDNSWSTCAPNLANKDDLKDIIDNLTGTLYFDASGNQLPGNSGAAYEIKKDGSNYTLTSIADSALTIDLTEVDTDKLANLTINLATGNGAQQVKLKDEADLKGLTLGAGDSVLDSEGNTLAKAGTASGTVTVANGTVTALTGGSFVGVGEHIIDATSAVTIDGVTFAAGAKGTFTNGAEAAADTFALTAGTASIGSNFEGTTVTANEQTYTVVPGSTAATFSGTANEVTGFTSGKITLTAADNTSYTIGGQTISDGNGAELTFIAANPKPYLCSTGEGAISLSAGESITVFDETGANTKQIAAGDGSTIDVAVTNGKYTISGLDDGEKVSIGGKHYLYHQDTNFLEEYDAGYQTGKGTGYILNENSSSISFTCDGNAGPGDLDITTAMAMPTVLYGDGVLGTICRAMPAGATYYFGADGKRTDEQNDAAYTLTKSTDGYTLTSNANANSDLNFVDASGLTNLKVDFSAEGDGAQTLKVDNTTTLSSDSKLGAGDKLTDGTNTLLTVNAATTLSVAAGPDISVASGANVTVPATTGIKTTGAGDYTVNGISVTTKGDSAPFIIIIPDAENATTLTLDNMAESETFTANTAGKNYTVGGQTFKNVSAGVEINSAGTATLTGNQSVTVGTADTVIQPISGNGVQVTLTGGKYTLSGLEDGEEVSLGGKTYRYRANTKFLEEYNGTYSEGSGDGFILNSEGSITFNSDGTLDTTTASAMPTSLAGDDALGIICHAVAVGSTYTFKADGTRADTEDETAYTLTKTADGYTLASTNKATENINFDASGITGLTVDFSAGNGAQTLKVDNATTLSSGSKLGAGDTIIDGNNAILVKASGDEGGTVTVEGGNVTLNSGTFEGTGNNATPISATASVTIDGVTFGAGAAGTFTNGEKDTFDVTQGTATTGSTFNGTEVKANGVTYKVTPPTEATFDGAANAVTNFKSGKITLTTTDNTPYTIGGQTVNDGNGEDLTFIAKDNETYLSGTTNKNGGISLKNCESVTVSDAEGNNPTTITSLENSTVNVSVATDGKYTLSGLDDGEKVSIGGKTYLYRKDTQFLEEFNATYPEGSGDGFILTNDGSISFNNDGTLDEGTATSMPSSLAEDGALETICKAVPEGATNKYYFDKDGKRANPPDSAAYTLEKAEDGSYVLKSTPNCEGELPIDARGLTNLTVDFSEGSGQQALKVDSKTTLSPNTKLGAGDTITDGNNILVKASGDGGTVTVEGGKVTLNSGTFEGTGTNAAPISATAPVTIDGVTFAEGAEGTFTNGTPDTFEVSKGQATIDKNFNGTEVRTKGVTYTVAPPTEATFDGATNEVTDFKSGKITFTATDDKSYTIGGQTISDGNGEVLTFIAKDNETYLSGTTNNHGGISLKPGESITVTDENGKNPTTIAPLGDDSTVNVSVASGGKYTLSGLDDGEKVSIGDKTYLYRKDTQFLEEFNATYPEGSGDGFILTNDGSISFNNDGTLNKDTAASMPSSLAEEGALDKICRTMPEGNTYYFKSDGTRADSPQTAAYTLKKTSEGYELASTENCTGELPIDARGLTKLKVDFSAGSGKQTLDVDEKTELATGSTLGTGDVITYNGAPYITGTAGNIPVSLNPGKTLTIGDLEPGTAVSIAPGKSVNMGNSVYTAAGNGIPLTISKSTDGTGTIGVQSGTLEAAEGIFYTMLDKEGNKGDVVKVTGKAEITTDATGKAAVTGLDEVGEKVVIKNSEGQETTYEVIGENLIKKVDSEGNITHWTVTDSSKLTLTDGEETPQGAEFKAALVATKDKTAEGETYLTANGVTTGAGEDDIAAVLTKDGNKKTLEVSKDMELSVQLTGDTLTVKDKGTNTTYNLTDTTEISASGATFNTAEGVVSDVTGTLTVKEGELDTKDGSDKAKYALSEGTKVNFQPGSPLSGTTVTTAEGNAIVIKESDNTNTTTVDSRGNITGVDGNAEIKGVPDGATVTTTGSGTLSLNGKTWEVKGDSDGATFTAASDGISGVTGLAEGATLSTTDNVSGLTLKGCTITSAQNGLSYIAGRTEDSGEFRLAHQGDSIRLADGSTFTVDTNQNGVSIGTDGKLTGLTDGEKVTVTTEDGTKLVYEVTGNTLVTTQTAPDGTVTTMTSILPAGETAFSIEAGQLKAANGSTDADKLLANADINAGSTEISPVSTVTNGMLLDKKGHATADSDKAIAEITIKDDGVLKYEATKEVRQTIQIGAGSTAEWEITTTDKADTIEYAGSHAVSITSRDGNDKITISGTGEAVVRGESGRNTIIHTGTGDATLQGGIGNDTITSTHADDTITGGEGKDTFILTNVESHVTDFTYG